jgi:hypothetical protein
MRGRTWTDRHADSRDGRLHELAALAEVAAFVVKENIVEGALPESGLADNDVGVGGGGRGVPGGRVGAVDVEVLIAHVI